MHQESHFGSIHVEGLPMDSHGSVSCWIDDARTGCDWAAARLWERYHPQLMAVARRKLEGSSRRVADEEDVVVSAFQSFLRRSRGAVAFADQVAIGSASMAEDEQLLTPEATRCVMTQIVMPGHTNGPGGVLFGGVMMQWIDVCAGVAAMRPSLRRWR